MATDRTAKVTWSGSLMDGGGSVMMGPMEVPGGAWILNCLDPQGAYFSLVAATR